MTNELNTVRLQNAVFCAECEIISDSPHDLCEVCGSRSLVSLSRLLGGPLPAQRTQMIENVAVNAVIATTPLMLSSRPHGKYRRRWKHAA